MPFVFSSLQLAFHLDTTFIFPVTADVEEDEGLFEVSLQDGPSRCSLHRRIAEAPDGRSLEFRGRQYVLVPRLALADVPEDTLVDALAALETPARVALVAKGGPRCGEDSISAVNLTRNIDRVPDADVVKGILEALTRSNPAAGKVLLIHYLGGPCNPKKVATCIVPGGKGPGWTIVNSLRDAVKLAASRAARGVGGVSPGQTVRLVHLSTKPELNGEVGLALYLLPAAGRWYGLNLDPRYSHR